MSTTRLYQRDVYIREWDCTIVDVTEDQNHPGQFLLHLDRTAFFPEGGGQSCDQGYINECRVTDVQEDGEEILHRVTCPEAAPPPSLGEKVHCQLDWDRRFDNMQRHCGEHILSGIFYARCGGVNRGFHMGQDYMTIDISLEDEPADSDALKPEEINMELALDCERRANRVIWSDAPVSVFRFDDREAVKGLPLRKALAFDEDISIVCVGSPENASDCVACCGTHPSSAGQVGLIKIYKVENYKGMFRIYFDAGERALRDYETKHSILTDLAAGHSTSPEELPHVIRSMEEKNAAIKDELVRTKRSLIRREKEDLDRLLAEGAGNETDPEPAGETGLSGQSPCLLHRLEDLNLDDTFNLAKEYMGEDIPLILLYSVPDTSFILVSGGEPHCGNLVREYASFYQGKGGGNQVSARAIFSTDEDAMLFWDLLRKHLKG